MPCTWPPCPSRCSSRACHRHTCCAGSSSRCRSSSSRLLLPFVATGPRIDVLGLSVSEPGLQGAWALLAKGTLGVLAALLLAATTEPRDLLAGLARLRVPRQLVEIMGFMVRYLDVITGEMRRMRIARASRGFRARSPQQWPVLAPVGGRPVHPLLRARRAGPPGDAVAGLHRLAARRGPRCPAARAVCRCRAPSRRGVADHGAGVEPAVSTPVLDVRGLAYAYPDGHQALLRRRPARPPGRAGGPARPQRRRQDHARAAPQRHPHSRCRVGRGVRPARDQGEPARDPPPGRHRLPGPGRPAVHAHGARRRRVRPDEPRAARRRAGPPRRGRARRRRDGGVRGPAPAPPLLRPAPPGRRRHRAGDAAGDPGARRAVVQPRPGVAPRARRHPAPASTSPC